MCTRCSSKQRKIDWHKFSLCCEFPNTNVKRPWLEFLTWNLGIQQTARKIRTVNYSYRSYRMHLKSSCGGTRPALQGFLCWRWLPRCTLGPAVFWVEVEMVCMSSWRTVHDVAQFWSISSKDLSITSWPLLLTLGSRSQLGQQQWSPWSSPATSWFFHQLI